MSNLSDQLGGKSHALVTKRLVTLAQRAFCVTDTDVE